MPADEDLDAWQNRLGISGEVDHLRHVCQIVDREAERVGLPVGQRASKVGDLQHLQIDQSDLVAGALERGGDTFDAERLETEKGLREDERAGVHEKHTRWHCPSVDVFPIVPS